MVHCPECEANLSQQGDVEVVDVEARSGFFRTSKRFSLVACTHCSVAIGSGVAGAR